MIMIRTLAALALAPAILPAQAAVATDPLDALVADSPFAAVAGGARAATGETGALEFRGVVFENGQYAFSLYDRGTQQSAWVNIGQTNLPFVARSFDQEHDRLTVEHQGRTLVLELQQGRMSDQGQQQPMAGPPPLPTPDQAAQAGSGPRSPEMQPPRPAMNQAESQRLQELADEIRRRRRSPIQPTIK